MNNRYNRLFSEDEKSGDFWPTFTDMLATITLVLVLILIGAVRNAAQEQEQLKEERDYLQQQVDAQATKQETITEQLTEAFSDQTIPVNVDPQTGSIYFDDAILFASNDAVLTNAFKEQLNMIMPIYFENLMPYIKSGDITQIIIEGHTDDVADYDYNLALSQQRALNVSMYIANHIIDPADVELFRKYVTANGRSYSELRTNADGEVDREKSRRVEIKFRMNESLNLEQIKQKAAEAQ